MRVAHFIQRYPPALGGSEAYFARLGRYLAAAGDEVCVFTTTAIDLDAFWSLRGNCAKPGRRIEDGVEVRRHSLIRWPGRQYFLKPLSLIPAHLWQCLTMPCNPIAPGMWSVREDFDLVHVSAFPYGWPLACGLRLARRLGVPFVVTPFLHLGDAVDRADKTRRAYLSPALSFILRQAAKVFVQTKLERDAVLDQGVPNDRIVLQGMGVDPAECTGGDRGSARTSWGIGENEVAIGHLANQSAEKGTIDLLKAAEILWRSGRRFAIVLAGPEMPNFRRFWREHRPSGRVIRLGVLDDQQKRDFFAGIDLFALPSRSDSFGLVLLEAWANGVANVAYAAGGIAELVTNYRDGRLAPCSDITALAQAIGRLIDDKRLRRVLGRAGQERIAAEFRWSDKLELVRKTYLEIAGRETKKAAEGANPPPPCVAATSPSWPSA